MITFPIPLGFFPFFLAYENTVMRWIEREITLNHFWDRKG